jgi:DNA-binding CsgD family transcriptional regulator
MIFKEESHYNYAELLDKIAGKYRIKERLNLWSLEVNRITLKSIKEQGNSDFFPGRSAVLVYDLTADKCIDSGGSLEDLTGYNQQEWLNSDNFSSMNLTIIHPGDLSDYFQVIKRGSEYFKSLPEDRKKLQRIVLQCRCINARTAKTWNCLKHIKPIFDDNGNIVIIAYYLIDISNFSASSEVSITYFDSDDYSKKTVINNKDIKMHSVPVTSCEIELLKYMSDGLTSKEIASRMKKSVHTINNQRKNLLLKTGAKNGAELINLAKRKGWI